MKTVLSFVIVFYVLIATSYQIALAHDLKTSGSFGIVMHMDPDDDPNNGSPTSFYFEIKDKTSRFDPKNCSCLFSIKQYESVIYSQALYQMDQNGTLSPSFSYTFPAKGAYEIVITGEPTSGASFEKFSVSYDIHVIKEKSSPPSKDPVSINQLFINIGILAGIIIIIVYYLIRRRIQKFL